MGKPILVVVHGIGEHTGGTVASTVNTAATNALKNYTFWNKAKEFKDYVNIIGIGYDDIFEKERKLIESSAKTFRESLQGMSFTDEMIKKLEAVAEDNFFNTHVLDVIFYAGLHCEQVRARVLAPIAEALRAREDVHVLAHSMGTAVVHDALHKGYTGGFEGKKNSKLDPHIHKLKSLWMVANTSQMFFDWNPLKTNTNPQASKVNPSISDSGGVLEFYNISHQYDLVGQAREFKAPSSWVKFDGTKRQTHFFRHIETDDFYTTKNPHDLAQYIQDPKVSPAFLKALIPSRAFDPSQKEIDEANAKMNSIKDQAKDVIAFAEEELNNARDFVTFIKMIRDFKNQLRKL